MAPHPGMKPERQQRTYDHRLGRLVQDTGDMTIATRLGVPRSTAAGWITAPRPSPVLPHAFAVAVAEAEAVARPFVALGVVFQTTMDATEPVE